MALPRILIDIRQKRFDRRVVVGPFRLELQGGEFVALIGPSGCGKTTLLNLVAGLDPRFDGEIDFGGTASPRLGYVFQSPRLMPWLTVRQNIQLVFDGDAASTAALLERFGLGEYGESYPSQLSGGLRRRVALARAFSIEPDLLLLDEPFLSLDQPSANQLRDLLIAQWQARGSSAIFVTHALDEALALADRVLFLAQNPMRLLREYRVQSPRPRRVGSETVAREASALLERHPDLLHGQ